jgi:hypothetical protein
VVHGVLERVGREQACRRLNTTPRALRDIWARFAAVLGEERLPRQLDERQLRLVAHALEWTGAGRADDEVAAALALEVEGAEPALAMELRNRLESIASTIKHNEHRRAEEHDRVLTALMRTQQELNHLRYEIASSTPRKESRRPVWRFWERRTGT